MPVTLPSWPAGQGIKAGRRYSSLLTVVGLYCSVLQLCTPMFPGSKGYGMTPQSHFFLDGSLYCSW